jgi:hypothetical protein
MGGPLSNRDGYHCGFTSQLCDGLVMLAPPGCVIASESPVFLAGASGRQHGFHSAGSALDRVAPMQ